jgi:hypothetical protein
VTVRFLHAVMRAFGGFGRLMTPPIGPYDLGYVIPMPREPVDRPLGVPLSDREREIFRELTSTSRMRRP